MAQEKWRYSFTAAQISALKSVVDGLLPPIKAPNRDAHDAAVVEYWEYQLSSDDDYMEVLANVVLNKLAPTQTFLMLGVLTCLSSVPGTILLVGSMNVGRSFADWPLEDRIAGFVRMQRSSLLQRRQVYQSFKRLVFNLAFTYQKKETGTNPFWAAIQYPGSFKHKRPPKDLVDPHVSLLWNLKLEDLDLQNGRYSCDCDIVIVGSGAGGGVAAEVLSKAGYSVLVLEKGSYVPPEKLSCLEGIAFDELYEGHGLVSSLDGNVVILSGATLGGGTTVNWSCCLPLPLSIREEWVKQHNLPQFSSPGDFDESLKTVYNDMNVITDGKAIKHNVNNLKFQEGCDKMNYKWTVTGQNVETMDEGAGNIPFGDRFGIKRDGRVAHLQKAVKNGTRILDRCEALRILREHSHETGSSKASGVLCKRGNQLIQVNARRGVVLAAGSLHSPCLLRKSGLKNKHIGRHLRLHPATGVSGRLPQQIQCFKGAPMTTVCTEFEDGPLKNGYGAKIECPSMHPGIAASAAPCITPALFKQHMLSYSRAVPLIVLQRDSGEGQVRLGFDGRPVVDYTINNHDKDSIMTALKGGLEILLAAGAEECGTTHIRDTGIKSDCVMPFDKSHLKNNPIYRVALGEIANRGMSRCEITMFSAHQMGTCRMSASPLSGVVDCNGETWECDDLIVVDASVFPTATAVNPMMTVLAISHMLSKRFAERLNHEDQRDVEAEATKRLREKMRKRPLAWLTSDPASLIAVPNLRLLIQASAPVLAIFWFYYKHSKPLLSSKSNV
jgi:choline dehydrogenase-like flavoprotein